MKILVLCDDFPPKNLGGGGAVAFDMARAMVHLGHEVKVVTTVRERSDAGSIAYGALDIIRVHSSYPQIFRSYISLYNPGPIRELRRVMEEFKPDVVHAHNIHAHLSYGALIAAKRFGARTFLTCHDVMTFSHGKLVEFIDRRDLSVPKSFDYRLKPFQQLFSYRLRYNPFRNAAIRHILRRHADQVFAVSDALRQAMEDNGIPGVKVIHNAIDAAEWQESLEDIAAFKKKHGIGDSAVLFGGRLSGIKGGNELVQALEKARGSVPDAQLLVVGEKNAYADSLLRMSSASGMAGKVVFTGWLTGRELHLAYHSCALVASPSVCFDPFIMVNLEGMACRKPAVTTCFGGSKEVVEDGVTGYVVNPYDVPAMAEKIGSLLKDKEKGRRFGQAGRERAAKRFSLDTAARAYISAFEKRS